MPVTAKALASQDNPIPGHIRITPGGGGGRSEDAAYSVRATLASCSATATPGQQRPRCVAGGDRRPAAQCAVPPLGRSFPTRRRTAQTDAYTYSYEQAQRLMRRARLFDVSKEPPADLKRYGTYDLGRHCLLARRLLSGGATFVQVSHANYDTHNENFDFHLEQVGEFDRSFAALRGRFGRSRNARQHANRGALRVWTHAADQSFLWP